MPGQDRAHEARAFGRALNVPDDVERHARRLATIHQGIIAQLPDFTDDPERKTSNIGTEHPVKSP